MFFVAYAQTTPLFFVFGVVPNVALALAVAVAFSYGKPSEYAFLAVSGALGLASGIGVFAAFLFFTSIFFAAWAVRRFLPWQPLISGIALVAFFSFATYIFPDPRLFPSLASQFAREIACNIALFMISHAVMSPYYARRRRYQF